MMGTTMWERRRKSDPVAVALANRHYSRALYGTVGKFVGPPGRLLTFVTPDETAVWVSHWPYGHLALDHLDAWRCTLFRNEGPALSSTLIRSAMEATAEVWEELPSDGWLTWVQPSAIRSTNPGYCFQRAGWWVDRGWISSRRGDPMLRLRAGLGEVPSGATHEGARTMSTTEPNEPMPVETPEDPEPVDPERDDDEDDRRPS